MAVRNLRHDPAKGSVPIRVGDGGGLYVQVAPGDAKSWVFRFKLHGHERWMGLGDADLVSLAEARALALEARKLVAAGRDPIQERRRLRQERAAAKTFEQAALALIADRRDDWRNAKHAAQWETTLREYAFPHFGARPVAEVDADDVLRALRPIWTKVPETARRVRQRIEATLDYALALRWRPEAAGNPARWKGGLDRVLPKDDKRRVQHHPALPWPQVPAFLKALEARDGMAALVLRFVILTAARSGEARLMRWAEVDLKARVWSAPPEHMKAKRLHQVPLSEAAMEVLEVVRPLARGPQSLVFPGARAGRPLSDMALSMLVRGMACDGLAEGEPPRWRDAAGAVPVVHGFRTSFKSWSLASGWPDHLSELALAHADRDKVRAAYARDGLLEQRRPLMEAWGCFCAGRAGAVVPLRRRR